MGLDALMTNDPQEAKRRFDDVYRALLVIGPILSFSFSNYSLSQNMINFIYYAGFPSLITAVLLWPIAKFALKQSVGIPPEIHRL